MSNSAVVLALAASRALSSLNFFTIWLIARFRSSLEPKSANNIKTTSTITKIISPLIADSFALSRTQNSPYHKLPVLIHQLPVHHNPPPLPHIANHVPVYRRVVLAARLRIAGPQGHMEAAADLLVE